MSDKITWTGTGDRLTSNQGDTAEKVGDVWMLTDRDGNVVAGVPTAGREGGAR